MGAIRGDLSVIGLADLFQVLAHHRREGTLTVSVEGSRKSIYFGREGLLLLSDGQRKGPRLGEVLLRSQRLSPQQIERVAAVQKQWKARFGEAVVKLGFLTREAMLQAVREQVEEEIYDLFSWNDATFEFADGPPPAILQDPDQPVAVVPLDVTSLLLEAMRRLDEWEMISRPLGGADAVFAATDRMAERAVDYAKDPLMGVVAPLVDGRRTVAGIVEEARTSRFQVYRALYQLHQDGCLRQLEARSPAAAPPPPASPVDRETTSLRKRTPPARTVLVVSTAAAFRHELCEDLRRAGYEPLEAPAENGVPEMLRRQRVDALLLDAPEDLSAAWGLLLHLHATAGVPVIVLSPNRSREGVIQTIRNGARDYMVKPFARHELLARLLKLWEPGQKAVGATTILRRPMKEPPAGGP